VSVLDLRLSATGWGQLAKAEQALTSLSDSSLDARDPGFHDLVNEPTVHFFVEYAAPNRRLFYLGKIR